MNGYTKGLLAIMSASLAYGCVSVPPPEPNPEAGLTIAAASCNELERRVRATERNIDELERLQRPPLRRTAQDSPSYGSDNLGDSLQRLGTGARVRGLTLERESAYLEAVVDELRYRCW